MPKGSVTEGMVFHAAQPALAVKLNRDGSPRGGRAPLGIGHNQLLRLADRKEDVLRLLTYPSVPFTNNQAEWDQKSQAASDRTRAPAVSPSHEA